MIVRAAIPMILSLCLLSPARGEDPVHFNDLTLKAAVEDELWITDPTPTDMLGLVSLSAGYRGIGSLTGLEYAKNLETLQIPGNKIDDISPLAGLVKLRTLVLNNSQVTDLSPLSGLHDLESLAAR